MPTPVRQHDTPFPLRKWGLESHPRDTIAAMKCQIARESRQELLNWLGISTASRVSGLKVIIPAPGLENWNLSRALPPPFLPKNASSEN